MQLVANRQKGFFTLSNFNADILNFITHFHTPMREMQEKFSNGQCFWFAFILYERFSVSYPSEIVYNPVANHFATKIQSRIYDISGEIARAGDADWVSWQEYIALDQAAAARIYRDCIFQEDKETWRDHRVSVQYAPWEYIPSGLKIRNNQS